MGAQHSPREASRTSGRVREPAMRDEPTSRPHLVIDPAIQFGRVTIPGTRIPTESLAGCVMGGDSVDAAAEWYDVDRTAVLLACWWEVSHALHRAPSYRDGWERQVEREWGDWFESLPWPYDFATMPDPGADHA